MHLNARLFTTRAVLRTELTNRNDVECTCKVEMRHYNQYAAVGWGEQGTGLERSVDKHEVEDIAMRNCEKSTEGCKIVYSACTAPQRIQ